MKHCYGSDINGNKGHREVVFLNKTGICFRQFCDFYRHSFQGREIRSPVLSTTSDVHRVNHQLTVVETGAFGLGIAGARRICHIFKQEAASFFGNFSEQEDSQNCIQVCVIVRAGNTPYATPIQTTSGRDRRD